MPDRADGRRTAALTEHDHASPLSFKHLDGVEYGAASRTGLVPRTWLRRTTGLTLEEATAEALRLGPRTATWNTSFDDALARDGV